MEEEKEEEHEVGEEEEGECEDEVEEESLEEESTSDESSEGGPLLLKFKVQDFVRSVARPAWAKDRGCPWDRRICFWAAEGGHLEC